jgi:hypothetical protein
MAAGFLGVTGPRDLEFGREPRANKRGERLIIDLQMMGLLNPWAQGFRGGQPGRLPESLLKGGQDLRRARERLASRPI